VKAIVRRLRRLEDQARPAVNEHGQTPAEVVRERRRRRLETKGLPFEDPPQEAFAGAQSLSEAIRMGRKWALESGRTRASTL
jgi:hypothetical protein